jgi:hypothetical protein
MKNDKSIIGYRIGGNFLRETKSTRNWQRTMHSLEKRFLTVFFVCVLAFGCVSEGSKDDSIDRLVQKLSRNPLFSNGPVTPIELPADAPAKALLLQAIEKSVRLVPGSIKPESVHIIEIRNVEISHVAKYKAILFNSPQGKMIALLYFSQPGSHNWWNRIYKPFEWQ